MTKKATPNSLNYSLNSPLGFLNIKLPPTKPRMLSIAAVPDGNTVGVHHVDKGGVKFDSTGNFELPPYEEIEREELVLGGKKPKAPHFSRPAGKPPHKPELAPDPLDGNHSPPPSPA